MNRFNFKQRNLTSGPHLLGTLLTIAGLFALVSPTFLASEESLARILAVGMGAIILGLVIVFSYSGTLIDFTQNRFKDYLSICGYKFGEWTTLPDILHVNVISNSYMSSNTPNGISPTLSGKITDFNVLISSDSETILSFTYGNMDKAVRSAKNLASKLKAELIVHSEKE